MADRMQKQTASNFNDRRKEFRNLRKVNSDGNLQGKHQVQIERSLNCQSIEKCHESIEIRTIEGIQNEGQKSVTSLKAISSLLSELQTRKVMPFEECFLYYSAYIKDTTVLSESQLRNAKQTFKDKILGRNGLPVILLSAGSQTFVMLIESGVSDYLCMGLQDAMDSVATELQPAILNERLKSLAPVFQNLLSLASTNKDRYLVLYVLDTIFSHTGLKTYLGLHPDFMTSVHAQVDNLLWSVPDKLAEIESDAVRHEQDTLLRLEKSIETKTALLDKKRKRLSEDAVEDYEMEITNKKQKLESLKKDSSGLRKQYKYRKFREWKSELLSQKGKKRGTYLIDRGAEKAIFDVLAENSKAHRRRHGEEGTAYLDETTQRIQGREMLRIANRYLKRNCKRLIKSKETVRAFGKPCNRRSIQAKQHRGSNLWSFTRSQKKDCNRHINVHYNRAFIKNYTRLAFATNSVHRGRVLRIAMDDKCYLRCGTSEGFSRPLHAPVQLTQENLKFELPSSDYPTTSGYVAPGVILMVNEQTETEHNGHDKYVPGDVSVSVTCKPKICYPSNSTNWANDLYTSRLLFREEHELPNNFAEENSEEFSEPGEAARYMIFIRDSLLQFDLMTIQEDYERITEGHEHREREELRLETLKTRIDTVTEVLQNIAMEDGSTRDSTIKILLELRTQLQEMGTFVKTCVRDEESTQMLQTRYARLKGSVRRVRLFLDSLNLPKHRAIEIQTSDAGPGVSTKEKLSQIRLAEAFQIHSLDLQARLHYGPGDSRVHIAEKVMRSLNEHAGAGHTVPIPSVPLTSLVSPGELMAMNKDEMKHLVEKKEENEANECSKSVASLYNGKPCMGTNIHARVPNSNPWDGFFFDHDYMDKCHTAQKSSNRALNACPGSAYFKYQQKFFEEHYRIYDGGVEGIRNACERDGNKCHFHAYVENSKTLNADGWSDTCVKRVNAPVPDYSDESACSGAFHYVSSQRIGNGDFTENYSLSKVNVMSEAREVDDFCPRAQLHKLLERCGKPELAREKVVNDDGTYTLIPMDRNNTMEKVLAGVESLVEQYVGVDLKEEVYKEARRQVELKLKVEMRRQQKRAGNAAAET